jgi:hypothetical protein
MNRFNRSRARIVRALTTAFITLGLLALFALPVFSQSYNFRVDREVVDVYWESDGTSRIIYEFDFSNSLSGDPIDFIDVATPNQNYDLSTISATINGQPIGHIAPSEYIDVGIELGLGSQSIQPGETATVRASIGRVSDVLYEDTQEDAYASAVFSPTRFDRDLVSGNTDLTVRFHLPPQVQPDEPRWHSSPGGWPDDSPATSLDSQGRVQYTWNNPSANAYTQYMFGASFPAEYVPEEAIVTTPAFTINEDLIFGLCCGGGVLLGIIGFIALGVWQSRRRKLDYLPPKLAIEGHGIKRGLTAVEAAVVLETPLDKVLTMILFSVIKKGAAKVVKEDPLEVERLDADVELRDYEEEFLKVVTKKASNIKRSELQDVMVQLVKSVQKKMKGFSLKETRDYYRAIMKKAWEQIEQAETPEVKSERFADALEWTMLDRKFDDRTKEVFRTGPVYLPPWWWYYRPSTPGAPVAGTKLSAPSVPRTGGRTVSMPTLPGSDFAASVVNSVQNTASSLVSNVVGFTNGVTKTTNPPPPPSKSSGRSFSSGGGGCACACACACAGCACACAGGGR